MRFVRSLSCGLALACAALVAPRSAGAQPRYVQDASRAAWVAVGVGPLINLSNNAGVESGYVAVHVNEQVGYHVDGTGHGLGVALDLHQSWASASALGGAVRWSGFLFEAGARVLYDIQLSPRASVYLTPSAGVAFALLDRGTTAFGLRGNRLNAGFAPRFAVELRAVLADRVVVFARPLGFDFPVVFDGNDTLTFVNYEMLLGGGVTF